MRTLEHLAVRGSRSRELAIMLPGALQQPEDLLQAGFADAVQRAGAQTDLILVDLGVDFISAATDGSQPQKIDNELISPARKRGYDSICLGGISIGGMMALAYADRYPGRVDEWCLLSPYPGNRMLAREIAAAGGLAQWHAGAEAERDGERAMWRWLQTHGSAARLFLGYGTEDRFADGLEMMAGSLPSHQVDVIRGAHDWATWQRLWENFLRRKMSARPDTMETPK
jgi:hypothetical protein